MNERLQTLAKKIEENEELKAKLEELSQKEGNTSADYVALCQEYGIEITEEDLQPAPVELSMELSDDELGAVTGGVTYDKGDGEYAIACYCVAGGGGNGIILNGQSFSPCGCVMYGEGVATVPRFAKYNISGKDEPVYAGDKFTCAIIGDGCR